MTIDEPKSTARAASEKLPRRDWILLPCVFLGTVILLGGGVELVARSVFSQSQTGAARCIVLNDATTGARGIPNTVCYEKDAEGPEIEFKFNSCGHRAGMECGPKPVGTYRIVMTGSSMALGSVVQQRETFAALLPKELSEKTGRPVELYNESMEWGFTHSVTLRFKDVLAEKPDLILWILTPGDVERASLVLPGTEEIGDWKTKSLAERIWLRVKNILATESGRTAIADFLGRSRTALMLRHFLYQSPNLFVKAKLAVDDSDSGYLRDPLSELWMDRMKQVDSDAATIEMQARDAGVPFVAAFVPSRTQAIMVSMGDWPTGVDPDELDNRLRPIIERYGGTYIDTLPEFRNIPNPERYYFPVDGHMTPQGHAVVSGLLAKALTSGAVQALSVPSAPLQ
jgi:hypothetical protein